MPIWPRGQIPAKIVEIPGIDTSFSGTYTLNVMSTAEIRVPSTTTMTGIAFLNGDTVAGNVIVALYNEAGERVAVSASTAQAGTFALQRVPFTAPYVAAPGIYYIGIVGSSATAEYALRCAFSRSVGIAAGSFTAPASITPPANAGGYVIAGSTY